MFRSIHSARWRVVLAVMFALVALGGVARPTLAQADGSAIDEAVELGETASVGDYEVTIENIRTGAEATDAVLDQESTNVEPAEGYTYVFLSIAIEYTGEEPGAPSFDLVAKAVGQRGVAYTPYVNTCGYLPDDVYSVEEIEEDESAEYVQCWNVHEDDADSLVVYMYPWASMDTDLTWFSLGNDAPEFDAATVPDDVVTHSSSDEAVAMGETGQIGDYLITVIAVEFDATDLLLNAVSYNTPPTTGNQFTLVRIQTVYIGDQIGNPGLDLTLNAVAASGTEYTTFDSTCGSVPNDSYSVDDIFPGVEAAYNACWSIASDDADGLQMRIDNYADFTLDPLWLDLAG